MPKQARLFGNVLAIEIPNIDYHFNHLIGGPLRIPLFGRVGL